MTPTPFLKYITIEVGDAMRAGDGSWCRLSRPVLHQWYAALYTDAVTINPPEECSGGEWRPVEEVKPSEIKPFEREEE